MCVRGCFGFGEECLRTIRDDPTRTLASLHQRENGNSNNEHFLTRRYNFDIVNDKPLQGRYKWDRVKPLKE